MKNFFASLAVFGALATGPAIANDEGSDSDDNSVVSPAAVEGDITSSRPGGNLVIPLLLLALIAAAAASR